VFLLFAGRTDDNDRWHSEIQGLTMTIFRKSIAITKVYQDWLENHTSWLGQMTEVAGVPGQAACHGGAAPVAPEGPEGLSALAPDCNCRFS
jgi:hypothetical protein